ncbi:hypothetical protein ACFLTE_09745 [Bacteroidota bacterium]
MKTKSLILKWIFFIIIIPLFYCCEKNDDNNENNDNELIGTWIDTINVSPKGYHKYELIFDSNTLFTEKTSLYGIYDNEEDNELSYWLERTGVYELNENNIVFTAKRKISWDNFWGGDPDTSDITQVLFENCTYNVNNDILTLNYTTYPADAPVDTERQYTKINN